MNPAGSECKETVVFRWFDMIIEASGRGLLGASIVE